MQMAFPPTFNQIGLGQQLRAQRLAKQQSIDDVATQLKLPRAIVEAMESDDHGQLGAAVFARGRLGSYARLLGIPVSVVEAQFAQVLVAPPALVSSTSRAHGERGLQRFSRQASYGVLAATVAFLAIWLPIHNQSHRSVAPLAALDGTTIGLRKASAATHSGANATAVKTREESPAATGPASAAAALQLRFSGDSWVDIVGLDGKVIEHGTIDAGSVRNYRTTAIASVEIGNPGAVLVLRNGQPLDLRSFQDTNATRFTLSSDGKPAPVRD
jgi:cytoskeleton protein RodZ